jgi:hypothetical protein
MSTIAPTAQRRLMSGFLAVMAAAVGAVAAIGVFGRGDGSTTAVTSVRGERYDLVTTGIYAHNPERLVAEGIGWDVVTLFLVVPALLVCVPGVRRGSLRWRLFATGLLGYLFYQYLMYAMAWAVGPLLLPFVAIYATAAVAIGWFVSTIPVSDLPDHVSDRFPRRGMLTLYVLLVLVLAGMWLPMIAGVVGGELEGTLLGQTTLVVQALDLGMIVPLTLVSAVALWRRRPIGYLLAAVVVVKGLAMAVAISAMVLSAWRVEGVLEIGGLAIFGTAAVACLLLMIRLYGAIDEDPDPDSTARGVPGAGASLVGDAGEGPRVVIDQ